MSSGLLGAILLVILTAFAVLAMPKRASGAADAAIAGPAKYPYADLFRKWAAKYKTDPDLCAAHGRVESSFNPSAINEEDPKIDYDSSYGIMQVQLATAQDFGAVKNYRTPTMAEISWLMDPSNNIQVGCWNVARWQKRYPFDVAVQMYNTGERGYNVLGRRAESYLNKVREAYNGYRSS